MEVGVKVALVWYVIAVSGISTVSSVIHGKREVSTIQYAIRNFSITTQDTLVKNFNLSP